MKLMVVLLVLVLVIWLLFGSSRRRDRGLRAAAESARAPARSAQVEDMVACAHCGVHLPASQTLQHGGHCYCSEAHRNAGPQAP